MADKLSFDLRQIKDTFFQCSALRERSYGRNGTVLLVIHHNDNVSRI